MPRRRVSCSWTQVAAANIRGAATNANKSWTPNHPELRPRAARRGTKTYATANATTKGKMRTSRSVRIHAQLSGISVRTRRVERLSVVDPEVIRFEVFYDYFCPFVYRASVLLQN